MNQERNIDCCFWLWTVLSPFVTHHRKMYVLLSVCTHTPRVAIARHCEKPLIYSVMQIGHNLAVNQSYDTTFSTEMTNILFVTFAESNNALLNLYSSLIFIAILNIFRKQFGLGFTVRWNACSCGLLQNYALKSACI